MAVDGAATKLEHRKALLKNELLAAAGYYSTDYFEARQRLLQACKRLGCEHHALAIHAPSPQSEPLTIDITIIGAAKPTSALVLSSGVHGVEGLFGSAVQLAFVEQLAHGWQPPLGAAVVLIHAVNPYGFAWQRRFNEDNVDLNRNFLLPDEPYAGAPPLSETFRRAMKPARPRARFGFWSARMTMLALRHGVNSFWETLPVGQYDFPDWLFFGGGAPAQSVQELQRFLPTVLGDTKEVVHFDFHTGLGGWAEAQLLVSASEGTENREWWANYYGARLVRQVKSNTKAYEVRGGFGPWLRALFPDCRYRYATAEFGTYSAMRVIGALADELRWHIELGAESHGHHSRRHLAETFVPKSRSWRAKTLTRSLEWLRHAKDVLWKSGNSKSPF
jgi:predicted deacylase